MHKKPVLSLFAVMLVSALILSCFPVSAAAVKTVTMDKKSYVVGETVRVQTENWSPDEKDFIRIYYKSQPTSVNDTYVAQTYNLWGKSRYAFNTYNWETGVYYLVAYENGEFNRQIANIRFIVKGSTEEHYGKSAVMDRDSYAKGEKITVSTTNWQYKRKDFLRIYKYPITTYDTGFVYESYNNWAQPKYVIDTSSWEPGTYQLIAFKEGNYNEHITNKIFTLTDENNISAKTAVLDKNAYTKGDKITVSTTNWGGDANANGDFLRIYKAPVSDYKTGYAANTWGDWGKSSYTFDTSSWEAGEYQFIAFDKGNWNNHVADQYFVLTDPAAFTNSGTEITFSKSALVNLSKIKHTEKSGQLFIGWRKEDGTAVGGKATFTAGTKLKAEYIPLNNGESDRFKVTATEIRGGASPALRFITDKGADLDNIPNVSEYGAVIIPTEILKANSFKELALNESYIYEGREYAPETVKAQSLYSRTASLERYTVCLTGLSGLKLTRSYTVRGYIKYTDINGIEQVLYTDEYTSDMNKTAETDINKPALYSHQKNSINTVISEAKPIIDSQNNADKVKSGIMNNTAQSVKATGKTYYVSASGNNSNAGTSSSAPLKNLSGVAAKSLNSGDAVLFKRGEAFRGGLKLVSGVYYGAYGTGSKPHIYGSTKNYAAADWTRVGNNIWRLNETFGEDVGNIVFGDDEAVGYLRSSKTALRQNFDYHCDTADSNRVYLYLEDNPAKLFDKIEIGVDYVIFDLNGKSNVTVENLTFKYTGGHAVKGNGTSNIKIRYCEIGFVGGSYLNGYGDGTTRYGNAVELIGSSSNALVENNYIYDIYDTGVTHQSEGVITDFTVKSNLIERCGMGNIEYWHPQDTVIKNITYTGNILRYAGYGFGGVQRPDKEMSAAIMSNCKSNGLIFNEAENFKIENNVFEISRYQLLNLGSAAGTPPELSGNTYIQASGGILGYYNDNLNVPFDSEALSVISDIWGDTSAKVVYY